MSPSLLDFLCHILEECGFILRVKSGRSRQQLLDDEVISRAIVRSLEIIGEATKKVPEEVKVKYPHVPWAEMAGMRDVLIHDYFGIDYDVVWNTISTDIPELHEALETIIRIEGKV